MVTPTARKAAARHLVDHHQINERSACQLVGISPLTAYRYQALDKQDSALKARLKELATQKSAIAICYYMRC